MDIQDKKPLRTLSLSLYPKSTVKGREAIERFCLSLRLIPSTSSKDTIVDVLHEIILTSKEKKGISSKDIESLVKDKRKHLGLSLDGCASSNIRRILKQLKNLGVIEKTKGYHLKKFMPLDTIVEEVIEKDILYFIKRIKEYAKQIDSSNRL